MFTVKKFPSAAFSLLVALVITACSSPISLPPAPIANKDLAVTVTSPEGLTLDIAVQAVDVQTGQFHDATLSAGAYRFTDLPATQYAIFARGSLSGQVYFQAATDANPATVSSLKLTLAESRVLPPTFTTRYDATLAPGDVINLACATANSTIRYTTDGTAPTTTSAVYDPAIGIVAKDNMNFTIKAKAFKDGLEASREVKQSFSVQSNLSIAPTFSLATGTYNKSMPLVITGTGDIYFTVGSDPALPTTASSKYTAPLTISTTSTVKAIAIQAGKAASNVTMVTITIDNTATVQTVAPTFAPAAGRFSAAVQASISSEAGAVLYYTLDGTTPDPASASTKTYTGSLSLTNTTTVKALALADGKAASAVVTAAYVIDQTVRTATPTFSLASDTYTTAQQLAITSETGADIYYVLNSPNDTPSTASTKYTGPIAIDVAGTYTFKVVAKSAAKDLSAVATVSVVYNPAAPVKTAAPTITPGTGTYNTSQLAAIAAEPGATIYYTLDGTDPTPASAVYDPASKIAIALPAGGTAAFTKTITARALAPNKTLSDASSSTITINVTLLQTATPVIVLPITGPFTGSVTFTINSPDGGQIYYTLDNSAPTTASTLYTGPITLSATGSYSVKALAVAPGKTPSLIAGPVVLTIQSAPEFKVYYKGATAPTVWVWEGTGAGTTSNRPLSQLEGAVWPGPKMVSADQPGWFVYTLPTKYLPLAQELNFYLNGDNTKKYTLTKTGWFVPTTNTWTDTCPDVITPVIDATISQTSFTATATITLKATDIPAGQTPQYKWDNGTLTTFTNGQSLTVGSDWTIGQSKTLTLVLTGGTVAAKTFNLTRVDTPVFTGIRVFVKGYTHIHYWTVKVSTGATAIADCVWASPVPLVSDPSGWMKYELPNAVSTNLLFRDAAGTSKTPDLSRAAQGTFWYQNGAWTDTNPDQPVPPAFSLNPAGGNFTDSVQVGLLVVPNANMPAITEVKYSLDGTTFTSSGTSLNLPVLGTSLAVGQSLSLTVKATNSVGTTTVGPVTYTKSTQPVVSADPNSLRLYQVMVEAYQDGDANRNFGTGYGPSNHRGDIRGIINALPYIKSLGVNALWLTPIFESNGTSQLDATGYFCQDYFKVDDNFGTLADAQELVDKAHAAGLYVFFDGVFGHHKGGSVAPSPSGKTPQGGSDPVDYTNSQTLDFYKEVATYWINTLGIDGWRLDQAYQVPISAWTAIRSAVETASAARKASGQQWGTLGYMVGEIWKGEADIKAMGYGANGDGLKSAFDFPSRYRVVQVFACEESGVGNKPASLLGDAYTTRAIYPNGAMPNMMITNHDLVRFGDLIQRASNLGYGTENPDYWKRHKSAISFMASMSGPITLYYGDEYGAEVPNFVRSGDSGFYDDHAARDNGRISGFNGNETDLINYTKTIMGIRAANPALWSGTRTNLIADATHYADLKTAGTNKVVYVVNTATTATTVSLAQTATGGSQLRNLEDQTTLSPTGGNFTVAVPGLSARFLLVE